MRRVLLVPEPKLTLNISIKTQAFDFRKPLQLWARFKQFLRGLAVWLHPQYLFQKEPEMNQSPRRLVLLQGKERDPPTLQALLAEQMANQKA
jgi:hypothetical protein